MCHILYIQVVNKWKGDEIEVQLFCTSCCHYLWFLFLQFDGNWYGVEVTGSTLGIVGLGSIGKAMAKRARGFDMRILYHNRNRILQTEENLLGGLRDFKKK